MAEHKVAINKCYGGFGISYLAYKWLKEHGLPNLDETTNNYIVNRAIKAYKAGQYWIEGEQKFIQNPTDEDLNKVCHIYIDQDKIQRHNPLLIQCIEELGEKASGPCAKLEIETIYGNIYYVSEYDGYETLSEGEPDDGEWYSKYIIK